MSDLRCPSCERYGLRWLNPDMDDIIFQGVMECKNKNCKAQYTMEQFQKAWLDKHPVDPKDQTIATLAEENRRLREDNGILQANNKNLRGEISGYKADFGNTEAQTIAALRAKLQRAEEERDEAVKLNVAFIERQESLTAIKGQLVAKEAELSRYKRAMEVVVECLMDNIETLRYALNYVKDRGLSAEKDVRDSIQVSEATLEAVRRLGEGE